MKKYLLTSTLKNVILITGIVYVFILLPKYGFSGVEIQSKKMSSIAINTSLIISDHKGNQPDGYTLNKRNAKCILGIDQYYTTAISKKYTFDVNLDVTTYDIEGNQSSSAITLSVDFDPSGDYTDKDIFIFDDTYRLDVGVSSILINGKAVSNLDSYSFVELILEIESERFYDFSGSEVISNGNIQHTHITTSDEFEIRWENVLGAEEYDLEWTYIDNYSDVFSEEIDPDELEYTFKNNSTRIRTSNNFYRISHIYDKGWLIFRIRPIGRFSEDIEVEKYGGWSSNESGFIDDIHVNRKIEITSAIKHEPNLDWTYSATFAEEGKKKEVVSYFDGSLRNRQTVTRSTTNNPTAIVGETIYDYEGRPAVQVLPVPSLNPKIQYYYDFNVNSDPTPIPYSWLDFDLDNTQGACFENQIKSMDPLSGSSYYYSPNLLNDNYDVEFDQYIPDADSYPFSHTEYTPDNTGRIRKQGGVGNEFQIEGNHPTEYLYATPSQEELNSFFGTEVGYAKYYQKNAVIDPNGQISISYIDPKGNVIISGLVGNGSSSLDNLPSLEEAGDKSQEFINTLGSNNNNTNDVTGDLSSYTNTFLATSSLPQTITYTMEPATYSDDCLPTNPDICFDCIYDLQLSLKSLCGDTVVIHSHPGDGYALNNSCDLGPENPVTFDLSGDNALDIGTYTLSKKLQINSNALSHYLEEYLSNVKEECLTPLEDLIEEYILEYDTTSCNTNCESCKESLGASHQEHITMYGDYALTLDEYNAAILQCEEYLCPDPPAPQANVYNQLLQDVSPGGQYGLYLDVDGACNPDEFTLSLYNSDSKLPPRGTITERWLNPYLDGSGTEYTDINGNTSYVLVEEVEPGVYSPEVLDANDVIYVEPDGNGGFTEDLTSPYDLLGTKPTNLAQVCDFLDNFDYQSWPKFLVYYHPEYYYYKWHSEEKNGNIHNTRTSDEYDIYLNSLDYSHGSNLMSIDIPPGDFNILLDDPFFATGGEGESFSTDISDDLIDFSKLQEGQSERNLFEVMCYLVLYSTRYYDNTVFTNLNLTTASDEQKEDVWSLFRTTYLSLKRKYVYQVSSEYNITNDDDYAGYNGCIGNDCFNINKFGFNCSDGVGNSDQPCHSTTDQYYFEKEKRFLDSEDAFGVNLENEPEYLAEFIKENADFSSGQQCTREIVWEGFLTALARDGMLTSDTYYVPLTDYPQFTQELYDIVIPNATSFIPLYWIYLGLDNGDHLFQIEDSSQQYIHNIRLKFPYPGTSSIGNIIRFFDLKQFHDGMYNPPTYSFRSSVLLEDEYENQSMSFIYGIAENIFPIGDFSCTSNYSAKTTCLSESIMILMNELVNKGVLLCEDEVTLSDPLISIVPGACLTEEHADLDYWEFHNGLTKYFTLLNSSDNGFKIEMVGLDGLDLSQIDYFDGVYPIMPDGNFYDDSCMISAKVGDEIIPIRIGISNFGTGNYLYASAGCFTYNRYLHDFIKALISENKFESSDFTEIPSGCYRYIDHFFPIEGSNETIYWKTMVYNTEEVEGKIYRDNASEYEEIGFIKLNTIDDYGPYSPVDFEDLNLSGIYLDFVPIQTSSDDNYTNELFFMYDGLNCLYEPDTVVIKAESSFKLF